MRKMKKFLASLLAVSMLVGSVPASTMPVQAEETKKPVDAAVVFTDLHSMYNGDSSTGNKGYKKDLVTNFMTTLKNTGLKFSSVTSGGDAFSSNSTTNTGYMDTITGYIQGVLGDVPVNYVWSDHDRGALNNATDKDSLDKTSHLTYGAGNDGDYGTDDDANYYVYALSMADICSYDRYKAGFNTDARVKSGFTATVDEAIANFEADVAKLKKDRPLFIVSHQPLFDRRNDNAFAEQWFDAINKVAEGMDVAFFFGHNHKYDKAEDYYYAKGTKMLVATDEGWQGYETGAGYQGYLPTGDLVPVEKTLNFTHMCAGYMDPGTTGTQTSTTREGAVMAITIYDDSINYCTYGENGVYADDYAVNENVKRDHVSTGTTPDDGGDLDDENGTPDNVETEIIVDNTKIIVSGATVNASSTVKDEDKVLVDAKNYADKFVCDIDATITGEKATLKFPVPVEWQDKPDRIIGISVENDAVNEIPGTYADGYFSFDVTHFSAKGIALKAATEEVSADNWVTITAPTDGTKAYTYKLATDSISSGKDYLIVSGKTNGTAYALKNNSNTIAYESITVENSVITIAETEKTSISWNFVKSGTNWNIINNTRYLNPQNNSAPSTSNSSKSIIIEENVNNVGAYRVYRNGSGGNYYLKWNNSDWTCTTNTQQDVYLYEYVGETATGGTNGLYAQITGATEYEVEYGASETAALDVVKAGITAYTSTVNNSTTGTELNDKDVTWTFNSAYNGNIPGEYNVTIAYQGKTLGTAKVTVLERAIAEMSIDKNEGTVERNSKNNVSTGSKLTVTYSDGTSETVDVTVGMLSGTYNIKQSGTYTGLAVTYGGRTIENYTLVVTDVAGNNYPEYPNPGSVELTKTAEPLDQNTGLTRVDLSTSGLPVNKGVDVIVMLDTSSSMDRCVTCGKYTGIYSSKRNECSCSEPDTRLDELKIALEELETALKTSPNASDIRIAVTDFNGMYKAGAYAYDAQDRTKDTAGLTNEANTQIFTNSKAGLDINAFINASELDVSEFNLTGEVAHTGTNYDYAYDAIYQLGYAVRQDNIEKNREDRELYVLFMSDGAPNQYNYYHTTGGNTSYTDWRYWLNGDVDSNGGFTGTVQCQDHTYYYDETNQNAHRMASAIKGSTSEFYDVIRKSNVGLEDALEEPVAGDKYYNKANMYKLRGLGANLYSIAFYVGADGATTEEDAKATLRKNASQDKYYDAVNGEALQKAFNDIATEIAYAATNAVFTDVMGDDFKLQLATQVKSNATDSTNGKENVDTDIVVKSENIYVPSQVGTTVLGHQVTNSDVGKAYGDATELERVEFNENGTIATSNKLTDENILRDGVIYAKTFVYNTTSSTKEVTLEDGTKIKLEADSFYWTIGTINQKRYTLSYVVYLKGSMEGTREAGSYKTNNIAKLTYDNWLGNRVSQTVPSPVVAWDKAQVSYAFYLVNDQGQPLYSDGTVAPNFDKAYKVTNPVVYSSINLNSSETVISTVGKDVLPKGYTLYDEGASYSVAPLSGDGYNSGWTIVASPGKELGDNISTTYVKGYAGGNDYTNLMEVSNEDYAYTDTTVYFAVKWSIQALPDTVVIDYGLPVDISVLSNDMFAGSGKLAGIGPVANANLETFDTSMAEGFGESYANKNSQDKPRYGTAKVNNDKVRYTPVNMEMNGYDEFAYAVNYTENAKPGYYYNTVTVIPATTIYYEDNFVSYETLAWETTGSNSWEGNWIVDPNKDNSVWNPVGVALENATQGEDRPGEYSLTDANNIYGYDGVNNGCAEYSLGSAQKATVKINQAAQASFKFYGTGFDVISKTDYTTGTIFVDVYPIDNNGNRGNAVRNLVVDTYYGYKQVSGDSNYDGKVDEGELIWVVDKESTDSIYQVPVMKVEGLTYGRYEAVIRAIYDPYFDHKEKSSYDFYLDAIRIYDPANDGAADGSTDTVIEDAYKADHEAWPTYFELRNQLISSNKLGNSETKTEIIGAVFIDGDSKVDDAQLADYTAYGPNNEVYLDAGQSIAFKLALPENSDKIHIGLKSADGSECEYSIKNIVSTTVTGKPEAGTIYNEKISSLNTSTDMYYDLVGMKNDIIVIANTGTSGILSITNIKFTYTSDPYAVESASAKDEISDTIGYAYMTPEAADLTVKAINDAGKVAEVAEIKSVTTNKSSYTVKDTVKATIKTNVATEYITVNGEKITDYKEEASERIWTYSHKTSKIASFTMKVVAYNELNEVSEEVIKTVNVKRFSPKTFKLSLNKSKVIVGEKVKATVTTSTDVKYVTINGKKITKYTSNKTAGTRTWILEVKATKSGKMTFKAVAYNTNESASSSISATTTAQKFAPKTFKLSSSKYSVKKGQKYTVTVKTSTDVKYVTVNGKKITKYTSNSSKTTRTFKITYTAKTTGKKTVKAVAYNKNDSASNAKSITVTVKK